jgi:hypothetical protein
MGLLGLMTTACDASYPTRPSTPAPLVALSVFHPSAMRDSRIGTTFSYRAFTLDADGVYADVTARAAWTSGDPMVVRSLPDRSPTLMAVGAGTTQVFATYAGLTGAVTAYVVPDTLGYPHLDLSPATLTSVGSWNNPSARVYDSPGVTRDITTFAVWSSSDPHVATVGPDSSVVFPGIRVTAVAIGNARITANYAGIAASYSVSVLPRER